MRIVFETYVMPEFLYHVAWSGLTNLLELGGARCVDPQVSSECIRRYQLRHALGNLALVQSPLKAAVVLQSEGHSERAWRRLKTPCDVFQSRATNQLC